MLHIDPSKDFYLIICDTREGQDYVAEQDLVSPEKLEDLYDALERHDDAIAVIKINIAAKVSDDVTNEVAKLWANHLLSKWQVESEGYKTPKFVRVNGYADRLRGRDPIYVPRLANRYRARRVA